LQEKNGEEERNRRFAETGRDICGGGPGGPQVLKGELRPGPGPGGVINMKVDPWAKKKTGGGGELGPLDQKKKLEQSGRSWEPCVNGYFARVSGAEGGKVGSPQIGARGKKPTGSRAGLAQFRGLRDSGKGGNLASFSLGGTGLGGDFFPRGNMGMEAKFRRKNLLVKGGNVISTLAD